jgi:hypothetical protein
MLPAGYSAQVAQKDQQDMLFLSHYTGKRNDLSIHGGQRKIRGVLPDSQVCHKFRVLSSQVRMLAGFQAGLIRKMTMEVGWQVSNIRFGQPDILQCPYHLSPYAGVCIVMLLLRRFGTKKTYFHCAFSRFEVSYFVAGHLIIFFNQFHFRLIRYLITYGKFSPCK